jgi:hypothetical protein
LNERQQGSSKPAAALFDAAAKLEPRNALFWACSPVV